MWQSLLCLVLSTCTQYDTNVLRGRQIHVTSIVSAPFLVRRSPETASPAGSVSGAAAGAHYEGFLVDLLAALADSLGCRFVIQEAADGLYGYEGGSSSDGGRRSGRLQSEWSGLIGEVMRGEADLAVADLRANPARSLAVDFSQPIMENGWVAVGGRQMAQRSVSELAASGGDDGTVVKFLAIDGGATSKFFQNTEDPVLKTIGSNIRYVSSLKEGFELAATQPNHVFLTESAQAEYATNRDCRLKIIGDKINDASYAIAMAKGGALRDGDRTYDYLTLVNYAILKLKYSGELSKIKQKWWGQPAAC